MLTRSTTFLRKKRTTSIGERNTNGISCADNDSDTPTKNSATHPICRRRQPVSVKFTTLVLVALFMIFLLSEWDVYLSLVPHKKQQQQVSLREFVAHPQWHPNQRAARFPSIQDRVKLYMGNWYEPKDCHTHYSFSIVDWKHRGPPQVSFFTDSNHTSESVHTTTTTTTVNGRLDKDTAWLVQESVLKQCAMKKWLGKQYRYYWPGVHTFDNMPPYCRDSLDLFELVQRKKEEASPLIAYFGDSMPWPAYEEAGFAYPLFCKFRTAATPDSVAAANQQCGPHNGPLKGLSNGGVPDTKPSGILWKLESNRHWEPLEFVLENDIPWNLKTSTAVWRGAMTGATTANDISSPKAVCVGNQRCRFVWQFSNTLNVGITKIVNYTMIPDTLNGVDIVKEPLSMRELLQSKIIINLEGNDVSSGLKWQLLSKSVVLMQAPRFTSWAMEELLEPWVHYIPMNDTNAHSMVEWAIEHDQEAQKIAERASLFMYDMVYHEDAMQEERAIKEEIAQRYDNFWAKQRQETSNDYLSYS